MDNVLPRPAGDFQHNAPPGQDTCKHSKYRVFVALCRGGEPLAVSLLFATLLEHRRSVKANDRVDRPAAMTVLRPDAAHDVSRSARTRSYKHLAAYLARTLDR